MPQPKICIAVPSYTGTGHLRFFFSLLDGVLDILGRGWGVTWLCRDHDSMIARGRSVLATQFLFGELCRDATKLVFIDSDISYDSGSLGNLCAHDVDVVGGAYRFKTDTERYPMGWLEQPELHAVNGLLEVKSITPGFLAISRECLQKMWDAYPDLRCTDPDGPEPDRQIAMLFENVRRPEGVYDEGFMFCERWRALGGKVWVDPELSLSHSGSTVYEGHLGNWLRGRMKVDEKAAAVDNVVRALDELKQEKPIADLHRGQAEGPSDACQGRADE